MDHLADAMSLIKTFKMSKEGLLIMEQIAIIAQSSKEMSDIFYYYTMGITKDAERYHELENIIKAAKTKLVLLGTTYEAQTKIKDTSKTFR